jgi:hypothetical protein
MSDCPRNFTKEEIIAGLQAGRALMLDRRDAPELEDLLELERQGLVTQRLIEIDHQSSVVMWRWKQQRNAAP